MKFSIRSINLQEIFKRRKLQKSLKTVECIECKTRQHMKDNGDTKAQKLIYSVVHQCYKLFAVTITM